VSALHVLADRIGSHQIKVEDEPRGILLAGAAEDELAGILLGLEAGHTPNAETIAAFEEFERDGGKSFNSIAELMAELNADD
jgi:hypothetical protein